MVCVAITADLCCVSDRAQIAHVGAFTADLCCIYGGFVLCFRQGSGSACRSIYDGFVLHLRRVCVVFSAGLCWFQTGLG